MRNFDTVTEALADLTKRGFTLNFSIKDGQIEDAQVQLRLHPENFEIVEVYRFEGETNPSDEETIYAIESNDGKKGVLLVAYGVYSDSFSENILKKLAINIH